MATNHNGGIVLHGSTASTGYDSFGSYNRTAFSWSVKATGETIGTAVRDYTGNGGQTVVFEQVRFHSAAFIPSLQLGLARFRIYRR